MVFFDMEVIIKTSGLRKRPYSLLKRGQGIRPLERFIPPASSISSRANVFVPTETIGAIPIWKKTRGR